MNGLEIGDDVIVVCAPFVRIGKIINIEENNNCFYILGVSDILPNDLIEKKVTIGENVIHKIESHEFTDYEKELLKNYFQLDIVAARKYKLKLLENL